MKLGIIMLFFLTFLIYFSCSLDVFSAFEVVSCSISNNGIIGTNSTLIIIELSLECDPSTVSQAVVVEQDSGSNVQISASSSGSSITVRPQNPWLPHQRFWLKVGTNLVSRGGKNLSQTFYRVFTSTDSVLPVSASLTSPVLLNDICTTTIDIENPITVSFSGKVDKQSVEMNFSIEPKITGIFEWDETETNDSFRFISNETIQKNSSATISIGSDAKDTNGNPVQAFSKTFDYCPDAEFPRINIISCGSIIFDCEDTSTYTIEDGKYKVYADKIQKDTALSIEFSNNMNAAYFSSNFSIQPTVKWREVWLTEKTVTIYFEENLNLEEYYTINLQREIRNNEGLPLIAAYKVELLVDGSESNYLECVLHENSIAGKPFIISGITYEYWDASNQPIIDPPSSGEAILEYDANYSGYIIKVLPFTGTVTANLVLKFKIAFANPGFNLLPVPEKPIMDVLSVQNGIGTSLIFSPDDPGGSIYDIRWDANDKSFCTVTFFDVIHNAIYSLTVKGGKTGVKEAKYRTYLQSDNTVAFKVSKQ